MISEIETNPVREKPTRKELNDNSENKMERSDVMQVLMALGSILMILGVWTVVSSIHIWIGQCSLICGFSDSQISSGFKMMLIKNKQQQTTNRFAHLPCRSPLFTSRASNGIFSRFSIHKCQ